MGKLNIPFGITYSDRQVEINYTMIKFTLKPNFASPQYRRFTAFSIRGVI